MLYDASVFLLSPTLQSTSGFKEAPVLQMGLPRLAACTAPQYLSS